MLPLPLDTAKWTTSKFEMEKTPKANQRFNSLINMSLICHLMSRQRSVIALHTYFAGFPKPHICLSPKIPKLHMHPWWDRNGYGISQQWKLVAIEIAFRMFHALVTKFPRLQLPPVITSPSGTPCLCLRSPVSHLLWHKQFEKND